MAAPWDVDHDDMQRIGIDVDAFVVRLWVRDECPFFVSAAAVHLAGAWTPGRDPSTMKGRVQLATSPALLYTHQVRAGVCPRDIVPLCSSTSLHTAVSGRGRCDHERGRARAAALPSPARSTDHHGCGVAALSLMGRQCLTRCVATVCFSVCSAFLCAEHEAPVLGCTPCVQWQALHAQCEEQCSAEPARLVLGIGCAEKPECCVLVVTTWYGFGSHTKTPFLLYHNHNPGSNTVTGRVFLAALIEAGVTELWAVGMGGKVQWKHFVESFEGSLEPGEPVIIDLGKTTLNPGRNHFTLYNVGVGAGSYPTVDFGMVHSRTYPLFGQQAGTIHYSMSVRKY